jgi:phosphohistidine swiveling domain-containing protein
MIDPSGELFKWGPIDAKVIYVDAFMHPMPTYVGKLSAGWPDIFLYLKDGKVTFISDYADLRKNGEKLFVDHVLDDGELMVHYSSWKQSAEKLHSLEEMMDPSTLRGKEDGEIDDLFRFWHSFYMDFWLKGYLPEVANWGGEQLLKRKLLEENKEDFVMLFERLAAPEDLSFFQVEELGLLEIALVDDPALREGKLREHQKRFYWIRNSYGHVEVADVSFFRDRMESTFKEGPRKLIDRISRLPEDTKSEKGKLAERYGLSDEIMGISRKLSFSIWWQDLRKKYIFIANHFTRVLLEEIGRRKGIPVEELEASTYPEVLGLLETGERIDYRLRSKGFLEYFHESGSIEYMEGERATETIRRYVDREVDKSVRELRGMVVSRGTARGRVRILLTPKDIGHLHEGDVLVAPMTSPDYIVAMRKASAIVTDEGGMTCHAAIVSRELEKPCIVATRIATKVLDDGEEVEVDAEKGIIRRLTGPA